MENTPHVVHHSAAEGKKLPVCKDKLRRLFVTLPCVVGLRRDWPGDSGQLPTGTSELSQASTCEETTRNTK